MYQIQIEFFDLEDVKEVLELAKKYEDIETIKSRHYVLDFRKEN